MVVDAKNRIRADWQTYRCIFIALFKNINSSERNSIQDSDKTGHAWYTEQRPAHCTVTRREEGNENGYLESPWSKRKGTRSSERRCEHAALGLYLSLASHILSRIHAVLVTKYKRPDWDGAVLWWEEKMRGEGINLRWYIYIYIYICIYIYTHCSIILNIYSFHSVRSCYLWFSAVVTCWLWWILHTYVHWVYWQEVRVPVSWFMSPFFVERSKKCVLCFFFFSV